MKKMITDNILKDLNKNANILEIYCGYGSSYKILKNLGYKNYIGIDDNIHRITRCKSLFNDIEDRHKFTYYENINEFITKNKFDVIFCVGQERYKNATLSIIMQSAKAKIFYCIKSNNKSNAHKYNYITKIRDISKKLKCYPDFSWNICDNSNNCEITGINHTSLYLLNNSNLIMKDLMTEIITNMENDCQVIVDIMALIVDKYTCYNNKPTKTDLLRIEPGEGECENDMIYIENFDELHVIIPLIHNVQIDLDNDSFATHVLNIGDVILINKINYITSSKCLQFIYS
jgi:hypothetical protein